jgi:hypothetical protein
MTVAYQVLETRKMADDVVFGISEPISWSGTYRRSGCTWVWSSSREAMVGESSAIRHPSSTDSGFGRSSLTFDDQFEIAGDTRNVSSRRGSQLAAAHTLLFQDVHADLRSGRSCELKLDETADQQISVVTFVRKVGLADFEKPSCTPRRRRVFLEIVIPLRGRPTEQVTPRAWRFKALPRGCPCLSHRSRADPRPQSEPARARGMGSLRRPRQ